jgi:integrase
MKSRKGLKISGVTLEKRKDKYSGNVRKDHVPILIDFKFDGQRVKYSIGYRIDFDKWNEKEQQVRRNNFNKDLISASVINKRINRIKDELPKIYLNAIENDIPITSKYLIDELQNYLKIVERTHEEEAEKEKDIQFYIQLFIDTESELKAWTNSTKKKFNTLKTHLNSFNNSLHFREITHDLLLKYINYQRDNLNFINSTNKKYYKLLIWFLNWATEKNYNKNLAYKNFKYKFAGTTNETQNNIVALTWSELQHFYTFEFTNKTLEQVRDIFCFCAFTSLRFSDIANLKKHNIIKDDAGNYFVKLITVKTKDALTISLNKYALAIWDKYKNIDLKDNKAFPVISNQKTNKHLKEAGQIAGLNTIVEQYEYKGNNVIRNIYKKWELLSTHTARRVFISNAIALGIQPDIVRKWTGHKDHKTMEAYLNITENTKTVSMNKFNEV